ncbi:MAG: hypothetical protein IT269_03250 [Saprospiraceae bacterium]|nr:hypothetical protein [Saprospiraceae bacterium]
MFRPILVIPILFCALNMSAQSVPTRPTQKLGIIYNKETTFNMRLGTPRSLSAGLEFGRLRTYYRTTFYHISLGELKHAKEQRQSAPPTTRRSFRPYVFGKQNTLLLARGGWGVKRYYSEKARKKGVAIGATYTLGPTLGLLKPYYLAIRRSSGSDASGRVSHEKYSESNADVFLNNSTQILGASAFTRGFDEISLLPGANASIALHFDWGAFDEFVKALEIGLQADGFIKKAPIMISDENQQFFFNFYVNLQFGKRK